MSSTDQIKLDRRIDLEWLDAVAAMVASRADEAEIRARLFDLLGGKLRGGSKHGSACFKTVGILFRVWASVPEDLVAFRDRAIGLLAAAGPQERLALHWAMLMANYTFFADVAHNVGRLLALQRNLTMAQVIRRMHESWGERSTVTRATQRTVRSMMQWHALADTRDRGVYIRASGPIPIQEGPAELLLEGLLRHGDSALPVGQIGRHPALFPFELRLQYCDFRRSPQFDVDRQSFDIDMVRLAADR